MKNFIDRVTLFVRSGDGGRGAISFRREKYIPKGGPDGGDGGDGGDVVFVVDKSMSTLYEYKYQHHFRAENGEHGKGKNASGKRGKDVIIKVPPGTVIIDHDSGKVIKEMITDGERFVYLKGGKGGKGNARFKSSTNQAPRIAQPGQPGIEKQIILELRLLADVGLVGFPNAGKSTLLSVLTSAHPEIGDYPFTTVSPNLGVMYYKDYKAITIADIPGLVEGASEGKGMGFHFLRHISRTHLLVFVLDGSDKHLYNKFKILREEMRKYDPSLLKKPYIMVINKIDIVEESDLEEMKKKYIDAIFVSAKTGKGIEELKEKIVSFFTDENEG